MNSFMNLTALALIFLGHLAQAQQTIIKDLGTFRDWKAAIVTRHDLWNSEACVAFTKADRGLSTLELYAPKLSTGSYDFAKATIQIVGRGLPQFVRATLENNDDIFHLTLASNKDTPTAFGLLARLRDRERLVDILKKANSVDVNLVDSNSRVVKTLHFSLRGSTNGLNAALDSCRLSF